MFGDVVVPLDGTPEAMRALGPAGAIAHYLDTKVQVVAIDVEGGDFAKRVESQLSDLGDVDRRLTLADPDGDLPGQLLGIVADHPGALLVMASHGADPDEPGGALAAALLTQSVLPMVLIGPDFSPGRFRCHGPLVAAIDADEHSHSILPVVEAFGIVFDFDVEIDIVSSGGPDTADGGAALDLVEGLAANAAEKIGAPVSARLVVGDDAAVGIVARATEARASLIAMATHGHGEDPVAVLGSTTLDVVRHAPCPVLAMRPAVLATDGVPLAPAAPA